MGCASSKPSSSSSKNKNKNKNKQQTKNSTDNLTNSKPVSSKPFDVDQPAINSDLEEPIRVDKNLLEQIKLNEKEVIDYIVKIVRKDLNADLVNNNKKQKPNIASIASAAQSAQDNEDLIIDVATKAISLVEQSPPPSSYNSLNNSLKSWQFLCKNQANKNRICDLTVETIRQCLNVINDENRNDKFDLVEFLTGTKSSDQRPLTPPQTPEQQANGHLPKTPDWTDVVLLPRIKANELARILFLSDRDIRPVIHASPKIKDAYFVNKQLKDNTEVTLTKDEIDEILYTPNKGFKINNFQTPILNSTTTNNKSNFTNSSSYSDAPTINLSPISIVLSTPNTAKDISVVLTPETPDNSNNDSSNDFINSTTNQQTTIVSLNETIQTVSNLSDSSLANDESPESVLAAVAAVSALAAAAYNANNNNNNTNNNNSNDTFDNTNNNNNNNTSNFDEYAIDDSISNEIANLIANKIHSVNENNSEINLENGSIDPILKQSLLDDRFYNNDSFKEKNESQGSMN